MAKLVGAGAVALLLMLAAGAAEAKHDNRGRGGVCQEKAYDHCVQKCIGRGGKGKASNSTVKCAKHCAKKC